MIFIELVIFLLVVFGSLWILVIAEKIIEKLIDKYIIKHKENCFENFKLIKLEGKKRQLGD